MDPSDPSDLDRFFDAYIECALWSSNDETTPSGGRPFDENYYPDDIHPRTLAKLRAECEDFIAANAMDLATIDPEQAGHDFWLTRNGHGAGFWDRGLGEIGDRLSDACDPYGSCDLYLGDDGIIYAAGYEP